MKMILSEVKVSDTKKSSNGREAQHLFFAQCKNVKCHDLITICVKTYPTKYEKASALNFDLGQDLKQITT